MIAPKYQGAFVASMEDILDIYQKPYDPDLPVICMDEQPIQLVKETRLPLKMTTGKALRYDYEYERCGATNIFMFTEPLKGWRRASVSTRKTSKDWAHQIKKLVDEDYPNHDRIVLICDNLNTHKIGSLYDTYSPQEARRIASKLEIHFTPKHGSWLNIAEIELSAMTRQCLQRRIPCEKILDSEVSTWTKQRNKNQTGVDWQFTNHHARIKLKSLYPIINITT